jgi:HD-GYP domain-containing protein (c-di-GMP phosphodiesterase class II)
MNTPATLDLSAVAHTLLHQLETLRMRARFLPARHPLLRQLAVEIHALLHGIHERIPQVSLVIHGGEFFVNDIRLARDSLAFGGLQGALTGAGVHTVHFRRGVTVEEVTCFAEACFGADAAGGMPGDPDAQPHIAINPGGAGETPSKRLVNTAEPLAQAREVYQQAVRAVVEAYYDTKQRRKLDIPLVQRLVQSLHEGINAHPSLFFTLTQMRDVSEYSFFHAVNVAIVSMLLGTRIGLTPSQVNRLGVAAMLHDVGKAHVPLEILDKPAGLDAQERGIMERHPVESLRILSGQKDIHPSAIAVALQHHVRYDCSGYPDFKGFGELHFFSHIAAIADVYDALRSDRAYKPAMLPDQAMEVLLAGMGKQFHPILVKAFFQLVGFYPVGSPVELNTGEYAVVHRANPSAPLRPVVKLLAPGPQAGVTFRLLDLNLPTGSGRHPRAIVRALDPAQSGIPGALLV